jgi:UDP-glucose 4-epimerase
LVKKGFHVTVVDDLSSKTDLRYLNTHIENESASFNKIDVRDFEKLLELDRNFEYVFHLAAQPDVKLSVTNPRFDFEVNVLGTLNILEFMRKKDISKLVFASSLGTVYGEPEVYPTPENYQLKPISNYGAAKAATEMYCSSYSSLYDIDIISLRLGNIYGPRSTHGVMFDFFNKLMKDSTYLEILGDGTQTKTYLHIHDTIDAFDITFENMKEGFEVYNVSSNEQTTVKQIAVLMSKALGLEDVNFTFTGGKRGWKGDVVFTSVDTLKLQSLGWNAKISMEKGIFDYVNWLKQ